MQLFAKPPIRRTGALNSCSRGVVIPIRASISFGYARRMDGRRKKACNTISDEARPIAGLIFRSARQSAMAARPVGQSQRTQPLFVTGGFSLNAALGGAHQTVSVDLSRSFSRLVSRQFHP